MDRYHEPTRTLAQAEDTQDLESVIIEALSAKPAKLAELRQGVWTYVVAERHRGTPAGRVLSVLTSMIETYCTTPKAERDVVERQVILWCVEAYFGRLGG